jgi:hypothetical protein
MATEKTIFIPPLDTRLKMARLLIFCLVPLSFFYYSPAQTNISGIVNSYYKVLEVIPAKACVRLNTTAGLGYGDKAMIIQMKGAAINTSDPTSSSFGDTTSLNYAGNYELGIICYVKADSVFFIFNFLNQYTTADKVQLVKVPHYLSANVTDTLKAAPWNNTTGTGGILAIYVDQDLTLNAPVYADSSGYRGGAYRISSSGCNNSPGANDYAYNGNTTSPQNGAYKGEGVADIAASISGGRGAPANGGGGGNNHNNGGGGGANLSAGGNGGGNSSTGTFNCKLPIPGKGGKALRNYGGIKIFQGGGGGAGHANNGFVVSNGGGHGGGIIFIRANNLTGNSYKISADGQVGGPAASDGASGGGGGGTIIMNVNNYTGTTTIEANGGQGGTENDGGNVNYCYGSGGGGSGGVIYFSGATPAVTVAANGGAAGPELGRDASCAAVVPSVAGSPGQIIPNYTYSSSLLFANSYCSMLLPIEFLEFTARYANSQVMLNWKVAQPELIAHFIIERSVAGNNWTTVHNHAAGAGHLAYQDTDPLPQPGYNLYRIKIIKKSNAVAYSSIQQILVPSKTETITIYPNPVSKKIFITGVSISPQLILYDPGGKLLWQKRIITNQNTIETELPTLPPGVYLLKIDGLAKRLVIR